MDSLTGGTFLAGLALLTGASNLQIAFLAAMPFLAQVIQLPAVALLLKVHDRRRVVVICAGLARFVWIAVGVLVFTVSLSAATLVWLVAASSVFAVLATAAWNWWMRDLLPPAALGAFFGQRLRGATSAALVVMLLAGFLVDSFTNAGQAAWGFATLFAVGGLCGIGGVYALWRTPHERPPPSPPARAALRQIRLAGAGADKRLVAGLSLAGVAVSFALPFAAIYMLRGLGFSLLAATGMAAISQLAYLGGLRGWAYISDRFGDRPAALLSLSVMAVSLALWSLTGWRTGATLLAAIAVLHFLSGYALSGIELSTNNLMLRSAPADNAPAFLATISVLRAGAGGLGVLAAGWLWDALGPGVLWRTDLGGGIWELRGFQVLCAISVLPCIWAIYALSKLRTPAQPHFVTVVRAVRREIHHMSSIGGMRAFIHAVSYTVEFMATPFASRLPEDDLQDPSS